MKFWFYNCKDFIDISKNICPSELTLEPSHGTGLEDHFYI